MKISELVEQLGQMYLAQGDLPVKVRVPYRTGSYIQGTIRGAFELRIEGDEVLCETGLHVIAEAKSHKCIHCGGQV